MNLDPSKMFTIEAYYPDCIYLPTQSPSPFCGIISPLSQIINKKPLIPTINALFDGQHHRVFNSKEDMQDVGEPAYIDLKVKG